MAKCQYDNNLDVSFEGNIAPDLDDTVEWDSDNARSTGDIVESDDSEISFDGQHLDNLNSSNDSDINDSDLRVPDLPQESSELDAVDAPPEDDINDTSDSYDSSIIGETVGELDLIIDQDHLGEQEGEKIDLFDLISKNVTWVDQGFQPVHVKQFTGNDTITYPDDFPLDHAEPIDFFSLYFNDEIFDTLVVNTNEYYLYKLGVKRQTNPDFVDHVWTPTSNAELKAWLGICIIMGIVKTNRFRSYWSSNPLLRNEAIARTMTLSRYEKLTEHFHVSSRVNENRMDKLCKIRWLFDHLNDKFPEIKSPSKHQALDESTIRYHGRSQLKQWNSSKPMRSGLKVFARCDSPCAYLQQFSVYLGKNNTQKSKCGLYFDVVDDLCKAIRFKNHCLYTDNLYTSIPLFKFLYTKGIYCTGTIKGGRKHVPAIFKAKDSKYPRGKYQYYQDQRFSQLSCCIWKDTRDVKLCSTVVLPDVNTMSNVMRRSGGQYNKISCPAIAKLYQRYFSAIDIMDARITPKTYGALSHCSKKMWKHLFFYTVNVSLSNALILWQISKKDTKMDNFNFRVKVAEALIGNFTSRKRHGNHANPKRKHELIRMPVKRPRLCSAHKRFFPGQKKEIVWGCASCNLMFCKACFPLAHNF